MSLRAAAFAALLLSSALARAAGCPVPEGGQPALTQVDPNLRLRFLQDTMNRDANHANIWRWGWVGGYGAVVVAQAIIVPFLPHQTDQVERYVGMVSAAVGMLPPLIAPPMIAGDARQLDARIKELPADASEQQVCELLAWGETLAARSALAEVKSQQPFAHFTKLAFNLVTTAFLGFVFHDWVGGALGGGLGIVLGEAQVLTAPTRFANEWELYKQGTLTGASSGPTITVYGQPGGVGVAGTF